MNAEEKEEIPIYRPKIKETKPILLPPEEISYNHKLTKLASSNGVIKMRVNAEAMLDTVSVGLYKSPKSAIRELLFNEVRACKTAIEDYGADARIEIRINPKKDIRSFEIIGIDSMGFSTEEFHKSFCETGASTNLNAGVAGQFGLGRLSYVKLSPIIRYDVFSRASGELYAFTLQDAKEMYPVDKPDTLAKYGTRLKLTLKDDVVIEELIPYIERIARFAGVKIELILEDHVKDSRTIVKNAGRYKVGSYTKEEYFDKLVADRKFDEDKYVCVKIHLDEQYFTYDALAVYLKNSIFKQAEKISSNEITLVDIPIDSDVRLPEFSASVLNLKVERTPLMCLKCNENNITITVENDDVPVYTCGKCGVTDVEDDKLTPIKPTNNRESLSEETDKYITAQLKQKLTAYFKSIEITKVEDYFENDMCHILSDSTIIRSAKDDNLEDEYEGDGYDQ